MFYWFFKLSTKIAFTKKDTYTGDRFTMLYPFKWAIAMPGFEVRTHIFIVFTFVLKLSITEMLMKMKTYIHYKW